MRRIVLHFGFLFFLLLAAGTSVAQTFGSISGELSNDVYGMLADHPIYVYHRDRSLMTSYTDKDGNYWIRPLSAGEYKLCIVQHKDTSVFMVTISASASRVARNLRVRNRQPLGALRVRLWDENQQVLNNVVADAYNSDYGAYAADNRGEFDRIPQGEYTVVFRWGLRSKRIHKVPVLDKAGRLDILIDDPATTFAAIKKPYLNSGWPGDLQRSKTLNADRLEAMPVLDINDQLSTLPGFYQRRAGGALNVAGARTDGNLYIIDGIQIR